MNQEAGTERRDKSISAFKELQTRVEDARGEFRPWMTQLQEINKYLRTDMTAGRACNSASAGR